MTIKHWDDQELAKVSADLDAELEQIFDEMEVVLGPPTASDEESFSAEDETAEDDPADSDSFKKAAQAISPARDREIVELVDPVEEPLKAPESRAARPARPLGPEDGDIPYAEILPDDYEQNEISTPPAAPPIGRAQGGEVGPGDLSRKTLADLSPDELSRLLEKAVARGVLAALKKWRR